MRVRLKATNTQSSNLINQLKIGTDNGDGTLGDKGQNNIW